MVIRWPGCYVPAIPPKKAMVSAIEKLYKVIKIKLLLKLG